jgi:hypothetical protein
VDHALAVQDIAGGKRQRPAVVAIAGRQIDTELQIERPEIFRQAPSQAVGGGSQVPGIAEDLELQLVLLDKAAVPVVDLGRDGDDRRAGFLDLIMYRVQSIQLCIAVRSPIAAVEGQRDRSRGERIRQRRRVALAVLKRESWGVSPLADDAIHDAGGTQVIGRTVHDLQRLGQRRFLEIFPYSIEACLKRHCILLCYGCFRRID